MVLFSSSHRFLIFFYLNVCLRSLPSLKVKVIFILIFLADTRRFCAKIDWQMEQFVVPPTFTKTLVAAKEKQPQSIMLPPP